MKIRFSIVTVFKFPDSMKAEICDSALQNYWLHLKIESRILIETLKTNRRSLVFNFSHIVIVFLLH